MLKRGATRQFLLLIALTLLSLPVWGQIIISEFMASNTRSVADEDGEFSDWIELLNSGPTAVNLDGWALTDQLDDLRKWRFPAVSLAPGESMVVFASDKDRRIPGARLHTNFKLSAGDYLALVNLNGDVVFDYGPSLPDQVPDVSFGVRVETTETVLVTTNSAVEFLVPTDGSLDEFWKGDDFNSGNWGQGLGGTGFDVAGAGYRPLIGNDVDAVMRRNNSTIYVRIPFNASVANLATLSLRMQYDDGFVASLNGVPVAEANSPAEPAWNSAADTNRAPAAALIAEEFDVTGNIGLLHDGENILAIHGLNVARDDPTFLLRAQLIATQRTVRTNVWRYFVQSTPGADNGAGDVNVGPLILNASFTSSQPNAGQPITVTARMLRTFNTPVSLTLSYVVMFVSATNAEKNIAMLDDGLHGDGGAGDGLYGAVIPATATPNQMVRWYLRAVDDKGLTNRWPPFRESRNSPQYLGTVIADPSLTNPLPVLHWFIQTPSSADGTAGSRCAVYWNGTLYDNVFANLHGQSSQGFPKKSYNIDFNTGYHFRYAENETPVGKFNLLTTYPDKAHIRNILAYETFRDAGHPYHFTIPLRVQRNGTFFSDAHMVEDGDEDFLNRVGLDGQGALYKMYNTFDSATSGVEKKTRRTEKNNDLQALLNGIKSSPAATRQAYIYDNVNIPGMVNYLAAMIITGNVDCCHKNYYLYRDTRGNGEWQFLPWDLDLSFGRNWTGALAYFDDTMYIQNPLYIGNNNTLPSALFAMPEVKQMYLRRVRTLMEELLQAPGTPASELKYEARIRELYAAIGPDAALDYAKWPTWGQKQTMPRALDILTNQYMPGRRNHLFRNVRDIPAAITNDVIIDFADIDFKPSSGSQTQEYICLTNRNAIAIDLSGWRLDGAVEHTFAPGTVIPSKGSIYLSPDVNAFRKRSTAPRGGQRLFVQGNYQGQLSARGETVMLRDKKDRLVQTLTYTGDPTPAQQFLRISEIMFFPPPSTLPGVSREELEYVVLKNIGSAPLNLNGVHFTNAIQFAFTSDLVLAPGQQVYVAKNPTAFTSYYGPGFVVAGPYVGQLANSGETVQLDDAIGEKVLSFSYNDKWYPSAGDGTGHSLSLVDEKAPYNSFDQKSAWLASPLPGGSAGAETAWKNWRLTHFSSEELATPSVSGPDADADNDGASNRAEFVAGTDPRQRASRFGVELVRTEPSKIIVRFECAAGRQYSILRASNLAGPQWSTIETLPRSSQSGPVQFSLDAPPENGAAFYRVEIGL